MPAYNFPHHAPQPPPPPPPSFPAANRGSYYQQQQQQQQQPPTQLQQQPPQWHPQPLIPQQQQHPSSSSPPAVPTYYPSQQSTHMNGGAGVLPHPQHAHPTAQYQLHQYSNPSSSFQPPAQLQPRRLSDHPTHSQALSQPNSAQQWHVSLTANTSHTSASPHPLPGISPPSILDNSEWRARGRRQDSLPGYPGQHGGHQQHAQLPPRQSQQQSAPIHTQSPIATSFNSDPQPQTSMYHQQPPQQQQSYPQQSSYEPQSLPPPPHGDPFQNHQNGSVTSLWVAPSTSSQDFDGRDSRTPTNARSPVQASFASGSALTQTQSQPNGYHHMSQGQQQQHMPQDHTQRSQHPNGVHVLQQAGQAPSGPYATPFNPTMPLSDSSPHPPDMSQHSPYSTGQQSSPYTSSPLGSAPPAGLSPRLSSHSPYGNSGSLASPFNGSRASSSSWEHSPGSHAHAQVVVAPPGQMPLQISPSSTVNGDASTPGTSFLPQQPYASSVLPSHQRERHSPSSVPSRTKGKAVRSPSTLAPAAAARVQVIARRCASAAKATRTIPRGGRTPSATSRSSVSSSSSSDPNRVVSVHGGSASGIPEVAPSYAGEIPAFAPGVPEMPPPPIPTQQQQGLQHMHPTQMPTPPYTSPSLQQQPQQQVRQPPVVGGVPVGQNGAPPMGAPPNFTTEYMQQAPSRMQFQQHVPQWSTSTPWASGAPT